MITKEWIAEEQIRYNKLQKVKASQAFYSSLNNEQQQYLAILIKDCLTRGFYTSSEGFNGEWGNEEQIDEVLKANTLNYIMRLSE